MADGSDLKYKYLNPIMCEMRAVSFSVGPCVCIWLQFWWSEDLEVPAVFCNDNVNRTSVWTLTVKPLTHQSIPYITVFCFFSMKCSVAASFPCSTLPDISANAGFSLPKEVAWHSPFCYEQRQIQIEIGHT